ncbi:restriction endonuclease subunit S [Aureivirga sp. CE67]|uniref:restriction endonuclease subunit S n=1 Tax=Aureivirga sp. CE67 TaxID=1788983 RepID=UPI0018C90211|nr:restriction endonuclease subunit S [Aureivirga sp. CE67]
MEHNLIPQLRFPEFQEEWEKKMIVDVLTIGSGKDYKHLDTGDIPVYGTGGYMTSIDEYLYNGKSVCIGRKGTINKPMLISGKFWTVDTLFYTHSFKEISPEFTYLLFQKINWLKYKEASGVPSLSKSTINKIQIYLPKVEEQNKIAEFLTKVDQKISFLEKKKKGLETYKKGMMQKLFPKKGEKLPELRFKDENGNEFPDWEEKKLGEICRIIGGYAFKSSEFKTSGIPIIRISNISNNSRFINLETIVYYDRINIDNKYIIKKGDLLIAMSGATTGKISEYNLDFDSYLNQRVGLFKSKKNNNSYIKKYVFSNSFKIQIKSILSIGAQPNISNKDIEQFIIKIPFDVDEQNKIAAFLEKIDLKIEGIEKEIEKMKNWKKGLLQKMFV